MKRISLRLRLTLVYGGMFLFAGMILLGVTFLLVRQRIAMSDIKAGGNIISIQRDGNIVQAVPMIQLANGDWLPVDKAAAYLNDNQHRMRVQALNAILTQGGLALLVLGGAAFGFGWLVAGRALRPLHQITATARRVAADTFTNRGLHERIALGGPRDEVRQLADTFDEMLERLDRSFDGQRRFVANASHELRTPLAINRALIEVAITRPDATPDAQRLGTALLGVNVRHERLIDGLLTLADSENELTEQSTVDIRDIATHVLDQCAADGLTVRRDLAPAPVPGDPILLERLAQNLVENAVRHNEPGGWLAVRTGAEADRVTLTVTNTGPVIAPADLDTIFEPFRRLAGDRVRSDRGFGLGLSIVRAVANAHGGAVTALPRTGGGLEVTVHLPTEPDQG
jgi:signal transduction histidine kinase